MSAVVVEVLAPPGSGALSVVTAGLEALRVPHAVWHCDCLDVLGLGAHLARASALGASTLVLASVDAMRPDFREEMMARLAVAGATLWVLRGPREEEG